MNIKSIFTAMFTLGIIALSPVLFTGSACAEPFEEWNRTFTGAGNASVSSFAQTEDGGYIITGNIDSNEGDAWLIKTDENGNEQWNKTFKGEEKRHSGDWGKNQVSSVKQTSDNGYILAGSILAGYVLKYGNEVPDYNVWLIRTDANGNEQWNKIFGGKGEDGAYSVQNTKDGGYIIAGRIWGDSYGGYNALLLKTDAFGNEEWNMTFGGRTDDSASSVAQTSDGGFVIACTTNSYFYGRGDPWLIKVSGGPDKIASSNQTLATVPAISASTEKAGGFEASLAITIIPAIILIIRIKLKEKIKGD